MDTETQDSAQHEAEEAPSQEELEKQAAQEAEDAEIVARAKACHRLGMDATAEWRQQAIEDLQFLAGDQWDDNLKAKRAKEGRPALTTNRLPLFVRTVTNEQRQSKPSATVSPVDSQGDNRTAEVLQGTIRNVEYTSNADAAYAAGGASAAITGLGYWDVVAEYEDERSFEQRLTIRRIRNPFSVVMDPAAKEVAGDDARWVLITTDVSRDEWEAMGGEGEPPSGEDWDNDGNSPETWVAKDGVRIQEYRWIQEEPDTVYDIRQMAQQMPELLQALQAHEVDVSQGTVLASEVGHEFAAQLEAAGTPSRPTTRKQARFVKIAGNAVLERGELAGRYLQLVRVVGTELEVDGKVIYEGVVRHAKDPQRMLNFFVSAQAEAIALTPKAPWIMAEGQDEGYEDLWASSNTATHAVLKYKTTSVSGQPVPPPQRVMAEANIQAISQALAVTNQQFSDTSGIYPTQFGAPSPEQSGRAILARQSQGQTSNFHFTDNFAMAIRYTGRILVDLIPKIYSGPRMMRILGDDGKQEMVPVNGQPGSFRGEEVSIPLDAGRYDVAVTMGPSYLSRRQEAAALMLELMRSVPSVAMAIPDLVVRAMDVPDGQQIAERLEKLLPPQIRPPDMERQPPPAVLAQQLQQAMAQNQQMAQHLHALSQVVETKSAELASKERIALLNAQVELMKTKAQLHSTDANAALDRELAKTDMAIQALGAATPAEADDAQQPQPSPQPGAPNGGPQLAPAGNGSPAVPGGNPGVLLPGAGPTRGFPGAGGLPGR